MLERIICALLGHRYVVERMFGPYTRKVGCTRCNRKWVMHDHVQAFLPWDQEFEELYKPGGVLNPANTQGEQG